MVHEGGVSATEPSVVYSDRVENALLDLFCLTQAQSRFIPGHWVSNSWDSIPAPSPVSTFIVPGLDTFAASLNPLFDSIAFLEDEWDSLPAFKSPSPMDPVPGLHNFVHSIDPLIYFRILQMDFGLSSSSPADSVFYNSDPMSHHVFLSKSEQSHLPIVIDTGASRSITPRREDFISFEPHSSKVEGINSTSEVAGKGYVKWNITDQHHRTSEVVTFAYYMPSANIRLYSPQSHFRNSKSGKLVCTWDEVRLYLPTDANDDGTPSFHRDVDDEGYLSFPYHPNSNLPCMLTSNHPAFFKALFAAPRDHCLTSVEHLRRVPIVEEMETFTDTGFKSFLMQSDNMNLSSAQKELLVWHFRLGHVSMERLQRLMRY